MSDLEVYESNEPYKTVVNPADQPPTAVAPTSHADAVLQMISRAAENPSIDLDRMQRLMEMHAQLLSDQRRLAFENAFSAMQGDLPVIARTKDPSYHSKTKGFIRKPKYAPWEDVWEAVKPVLQQHGFALRFYVDSSANGPITVRARLSHKDGHAEETSMVVPAEMSGDKNAIQGVASAITYAKRYTGCALLNIVTEDEDTDANPPKALAGEKLTAKQLETLRSAIAFMDGNESALMKWANASGIAGDALDEVDASHFDRLKTQLAYWAEKRASASEVSND